jgi:cobalt-zinc-cadmium efflux system protein
MSQSEHTAHSHPGHAADLSVRRIRLALSITLAFVFVEILAGIFANSLALLTDAAHNITDVIALAMTWYALRLAYRPAHAGKTFGYHRAGILIALFNSLTLILIALFIFYEAYRRLMAPPQVDAPLLSGVAALAFVVNAGTAWLIRRGSQDDLNLRSAFVHLAGDALSTLGAILAGIAIMLTGYQIFDPLVSVLIGLLILWNGWGIVRESVDILLESTPRGLDMDALIRDIQSIPGVHGVHDVHAWSINEKLRLLSAHILTEDLTISAGSNIQNQISRLVCDKYVIAHATLQLECEDCDPLALYCDLHQ